MQRYKIEDMTCGHCARVVEGAIRGVDSAAAIKVDLGKKEVSIETAANKTAISDALRAAGYESRPL
ncbi:heavy-metal-associated domain-containing protein [Sinorhizobium americanum]|uniref:Copper chaperone n=1 Tax=Sinorhizobium americanum TaxID=194963 RepID=A0A4R2BWP6_9HYPH|nr:heavy-metal-associated domain-containing protein [Sinorhizobium americanum]TCN31403.1 copper chaperone [Sinorhizobium americanum]